MPNFVSKKEYIFKAGQICPRCKSHQVECINEAFCQEACAEGIVGNRYKACCSCGATWDEWLGIVTYDSVHTFKEDGDLATKWVRNAKGLFVQCVGTYIE